jgi:outer membrane lipoprotein carrier protein
MIKSSGPLSRSRFLLVLKSLFALLISSSLISPLCARTPLLQINDDALRVAQKIVDRYSRAAGFAAEFDESWSAPGRKTIRDSGRLYLGRPHSMRWEYDSNKLFVVNARDAWWYIPADREATHSKLENLEDARLPFLFLLGKVDLRRTFKSITLAGDNSSQVISIRLVPSRPSPGISAIEVDSDTAFGISEVRIIDSHGGTTTIRLKNVRSDYHPNPEAFTFAPPPGVTIRQ